MAQGTVHNNIFGGQTKVALATPAKCGTISAMTYKIKFLNARSQSDNPASVNASRWQTETATVNFENLIVQDISASVNIAAQTYYEIGSRRAHRVIGRPQGQGSLNNVVGPCPDVLAGLVKLCEVCSPKDLLTSSYNGCVNNADKTNGLEENEGTTVNGLVFTDCICTGVTMSMNAQQDIVNGQWTLMFCDLINETGAGGGGAGGGGG